MDENILMEELFTDTNKVSSYLSCYLIMNVEGNMEYDLKKLNKFEEAT